MPSKYQFIVAVAAVLFLASPAAFGAESKVRNFDLDHVPGELIIKYKDDPTVSTKAALATAGLEHRADFKNRAMHVRVPLEKRLGAFDTETYARQLAADPNVEYVEANYIIHIEENPTPNDPDFQEQYGLQKIAAQEAWNTTKGSKRILVGVIDTGVDYSHPDIAPNYWNNPGETGLDADGNDKSSNGIDDDNNGYVDDFQGWDFANNDNDPFDDNRHGTHCAGVIGAASDNETGIAGINWNVSIVGLKFLTGSGGGTLADAVKAIEYATTIGVNLTSNSWGGGGFSQPMFDAIKAAEDAGILFVAAAGNSASNNDSSATYPASYELDNVVAVAATDSEDQVAWFSNYGEETVHLAAPGVDILSTIPGGEYETLSGTSMAAPHVSGAAALVWSANRNASAAEIKALLLDSVDSVEGLKVKTGGRLNVARAIELAR